jgi:cytochrome c553
MRIISLQTLVPAAILAIVFTTAGRAEETSPVTVSQQELQAKIAYCKTCHGLSGQGFRGAFPMPRLAGQQPEYLENQLRAFNERRRTNPIMFNVAHVLNPPMITALAAHFKDLDAKPLGGAPKELVATGKTLYEEGVPHANVPPNCPASFEAFFFVSDLAIDEVASGYQRLLQLPRHPPPPRTSLMISNSISAPTVALMIAAIMPEPRWMPS